MSFYEEPSGIIFYRSLDPLENLRIRVTIRKVVFGAVWNLETTSSGTVHRTADDQMRQKQQEESYTFGWQEKIYSKRELAYYRDVRNCDTVHKKAAHDAVSSMAGSDLAKHGRKLFSFVDADAKDSGNEGESLLDDPSIPETYLTHRVRSYRPRKPRIGDINMLQRPSENVIGYLPASRRVGNVPSAVMYFMADLTALNSEPQEENEYLLCTIRIDTDGLIAVEPDFNALKKPYLIQTERGTREMYEYFIEHASQPMNRVDLERERQLFRTLYQRHHDAVALLVGSTFNKVQQDCLRIGIHGEIVQAEKFEYDNLFVHYLLQLPKGWTSVWDNGTKEPSHFSTQISTRGADGKWTFACPFSWISEHTGPQSGDTDAAEEEQFCSWPKLFFEVASLDSWNRYRVEGYGYLNVPLRTQSTSTVIRTWRPIGYTFLSRLRRYFIGGSPELDDVSYTSVPKDFQGKELSKYGFPTAPSGNLTVNLHVIVQRSAPSMDADEFSPVKKTRMANRQIQNFGGDRGVEDVLEAFKRARRRLLAARALSPH